MSFGIPLSQLIIESPKPLSSGITGLDEILSLGFQARSIYEIFGPPGIGKTNFGIQLVSRSLENMKPLEKNDDKILWIEAFQDMPINILRERFPKFDIVEENVKRVRIMKFGQLLYFFQNLFKLSQSMKYKLIIIDGFSQLLCDHLCTLSKRSGGVIDKTIHDLKCRHLILIFTAMTKYTHSTGSTIILLNDCMNTAFQSNEFGSLEEDYEVLEDGSNFYVNSNSDRRKSNVHILKSALVANIAMGGKDSTWEVFLRDRIGLFRDWNEQADETIFVKSKRVKTPSSQDNEACTIKEMRINKRNFENFRIAIVFNLHGDDRERDRDGGRPKRTRNSEDRNRIVKFDFDRATGLFRDIIDQEVNTANIGSIPTLSASSSSCSQLFVNMESDDNQMPYVEGKEEVIYDSEG
ncbi:DNA repair protein rad55 [Saccharomyces pastorianus]|uniref:DNA repair protein rad55 n=1 Tax=Saccharomyces pastorianus TaxID=27292 RepID=A0A6C1E334_SACPS|nr:RAD55-like protein [Saccharomyces eubayanus]KOH00929.1 RAD55-like protein [Saccharomyces eubayanus]QID83419.1 DNA repair protein rad55 [Saccharomyces pastorianus]